MTEEAVPPGFLRLTNARTGRPLLVRLAAVDAVEADYLTSSRGVRLRLRGGGWLEVLEPATSVSDALSQTEQV